MTGGGIQLMLHPGDEFAQMQLELVGEELLYEWDAYADFNVNGVVDKQDTAIWESHLGVLAAGFAEGDANFDGAVTGPDLLEVQRQFGMDPRSRGRLAQSVPEPASLLLAVGVVVWIGSRHSPNSALLTL
jgi:hypothetical protein